MSLACDRDAAAAPCLRLRTELLLVNEGSSLAPRFREVELPVMDLWWRGTPDAEAERRARTLLESLGALELDCLEQLSAAPGSRANYVLRADADVHAHAACSFSAYALPQLSALGWRVEVAPDYPYQVIGADAPWYGRLEPSRDDTDENGRSDWFGLELGVEVDGQRINLLPALLALIERLPEQGRFESWSPPGARCFALPVGPNRFVALPPERLSVLVAVLRELYDGADRDQPLRVPACEAARLAELDVAFDPGHAPVDGPVHARAERRAPTPAARPAAEAPALTNEIPGLRAQLRPYQQAGVAWMQSLVASECGGVLADDMGLGKTLQTIAHIVAEKAAGRLDRPVLVVAPTSLVPNWKRELAKFAPDLRVLAVVGAQRRWLWSRIDKHDVVLTTYPLLVRDEEIAAQKAFHLVVLDEAQAIKNPRSVSHRAVRQLETRHRLCLSGTPVENTLRELWSLFEFVMPGFLGDEDWFRVRYAQPIERGANQERLKALRTVVGPYILRRTKEEVAPELPPKTELVRPVDLLGAQRDLYESLRVAVHAEVRQAIAAKGLGGSTIAILDALMRLRQVCCDPRLLPARLARDVRESAKLTALLDLLSRQLPRGRRALVFSQFASMLALIGNALDQRGIRYVTLTGQTADRGKPVEAFERGDVDVFLISLKAGGTGLNLTSADTVIHYDPWWNPAAQAQATDRAHRIGQRKPVFVTNLIVAGSVEERMLALQQRKRALAAGVLGRPAAGDTTLTSDEVDALFAPMDTGCS